jgi:hypothetical protein
MTSSQFSAHVKTSSHRCFTVVQQPLAGCQTQGRSALNILRALRLVLSLLIVTAIFTLLGYLLESWQNFSAFNFFCFFTNQSNLLVALFFMVDAFMRWRGQPLSRNVYDRTRAALILYMTMTSSIYWLFLQHLIHFPSTAVTIANNFLHAGALTFLILDWIWDRPETPLRKRFFTICLIYPLTYCISIMLLGSMRDWYPYPFLNIDKLGLEKWALWNGGMAVSVSLIAVVIILLNNRLRRERS